MSCVESLLDHQKSIGILSYYPENTFFLKELQFLSIVLLYTLMLLLHVQFVANLSLMQAWHTLQGDLDFEVGLDPSIICRSSHVKNMHFYVGLIGIFYIFYLYNLF